MVDFRSELARDGERGCKPRLGSGLARLLVSNGNKNSTFPLFHFN